MEIKLLNNPESFKYKLKIFFSAMCIIGIILGFILCDEFDNLEVF